MGLPVYKRLDLGVQITVLRRDIHQQKGLQHQGLSSYRNKAETLHKSGCANESCLFPVNIADLIFPPCRVQKRKRTNKILKHLLLNKQYIYILCSTTDRPTDQINYVLAAHW